MGITHVVRGEEWVSSTPKHVLLYRRLGLEPPRFAHMPLLRNENKSKISKRKNPEARLTWFQEEGYLPEALVNFLGLLAYPPARTPRATTSSSSPSRSSRSASTGRSSTRSARSSTSRSWTGSTASTSARSRSATSPPAPALPRAGRRAGREPLARRARAPGARRGAHPDPYRPPHGGDRARRAVLRGRRRRHGRGRRPRPAQGRRRRDARRRVRRAGGRAGRAGRAARRRAHLARRGDRGRALRSALVEGLGLKPKFAFGPLRTAVSGQRVSPPLFESMEILGKDSTLARLAALRATL